ncbi:MAG: ABC-type transport auxiliary lipoprotein family protein [Steroidobacteraceae bacterium]
MLVWLAVLLQVPALVLLAGCSGLKSSAPAEQVYVLRPAILEALPTPLKASLQILRVEAHPGLESDRIMLLRPGRRLDAFSGARFASGLPEVIGAAVVEAFRGSGSFTIVSEDRNVGSDFALDITVLRFEAQYADENSAPIVQLLFDCTLLDRRQRDTLASFRIAASVPATENRLGSVVEAMDQATNQALNELRTKTADAIAKAPPVNVQPAGPGPRNSNNN